MVEVRMLRWPAEAPALEHCRTRGVPRLLMVEGPVSPPSCVDALEDWVRVPADRADLQARRAMLLARAGCATPTVDTDGILRVDGRCLALPPAEAPMARALAASYRRLVHRQELIDLVWPGTGLPRRNALDLRVLRLRRRIAPLGLIIRTVWGRGYLMDADGGDTAELAA
jgi:two-component system OmpR family response regulator